jgi:gluconolactonase
MKPTSVVFCLVICLSSCSQQNELPAQLVATGAKPVKAGTGYAFTEGASVAPDGRVYFTDQPNDKI